MPYTTNYNLPKLPSGPVDWLSYYNDLADKIEAGRTIQITAGEALTAGQAYTINSDGKAYKAVYTDVFAGIVKADIALNAQGYGYSGKGNIITIGSGWTIGGLIYVDSIAGALTQTSPGTGTRPAAIAVTATTIMLLGSYGGVKDHGSMAGLGDDDHSQYLDNTRHAAIGGNPHGVTNTDVGLGNVTNDAQLKRSGGDINSFTEKTSPVNADILLIEDSENTFIKKKVQLSNLPVVLPSYTDTNRPSAVSAGAGTMIFNTDDNFPNVSDGTNWRDMSGVIT